MRRRHLLLIFAVFAFAAAWFARVSPGEPNHTNKRPWLQFALGPFRGTVAELMRIRAAFAQIEKRFDESIQLQTLALELDPESTASAQLLASEIAISLPGETTDAGELSARAREAIEILRNARTYGNRDPRILDFEAQLLITRVAPVETATHTERIAALEQAIALCEDVARFAPAGFVRGSPLLEERAVDYYKSGASEKAAAAFTRASEFERALMRVHVPLASERAEMLAECAGVCSIEAKGTVGSTDAAAERARLLGKLSAGGLAATFVELASKK
ncbi:MAG: hypothetical protein HY286_18380 [Planctomycetes bacterium]|nr:hypothetical protein [Planctomycetota bacterium]